LGEAARLCAVEGADALPRLGASLGALLPFGTERGDASVGRVDDDRRAEHRALLVALEQPDAVVVMDVGVALHLLAARHVLDVVERALGKSLRFLGSEE